MLRRPLATGSASSSWTSSWILPQAGTRRRPGRRGHQCGANRLRLLFDGTAVPRAYASVPCPHHSDQVRTAGVTGGNLRSPKITYLGDRGSTPGCRSKKSASGSEDAAAAKAVPQPERLVSGTRHPSRAFVSLRSTLLLHAQKPTSAPGQTSKRRSHFPRREAKPRRPLHSSSCTFRFWATASEEPTSPEAPANIRWRIRSPVNAGAMGRIRRPGPSHPPAVVAPMNFARSGGRAGGGTTTSWCGEVAAARRAA
jgi:hypothetical protein